MPNFIVVAFYTESTPYAEEIKGLQQTCREHGIHCHVKSYKNRWQWVRNAAIKPEFLLEMIQLHPNKKIVYLDADARVKKFPTLFETLDADIGVHYRNGRELLSGTVFLNCNARVHSLVLAWARAQQEAPETWDQKVLASVLKGWKQPLKVTDLPPTYCQIFDNMRHVGEPVIEHMQASRKFKKLVEEPGTFLNIPGVIGNCKLRRDPGSGCVWIARPNKRAEKWLDDHCVRVPNELRWNIKFNPGNKLDTFRQAFNGKVCHIIGKGPSLDDLNVSHFPYSDDPIIALNEAIHKVEELSLPNQTFGLQQDAKLRDTCLPKYSPIFVDIKAANYYGQHEQAYIFQNAQFGLNRSALGVSAAIEIAKRLGARGFRLMCFDACVNRKVTYAKCIGYESTWGGVPKRFLEHRRKIEGRAAGLPIEWVIPEAPASGPGDTPQQ